MNREQQEKTRLRVARWRAKNREKILLARMLRPPAVRRQRSDRGWTVTEFVKDGLPVRLVVHSVNRPPIVPDGLSLSRRWVPSAILDKQSARALGLWRFNQICEWGWSCELVGW